MKPFFVVFKWDERVFYYHYDCYDNIGKDLNKKIHNVNYVLIEFETITG